MKCGLVYITYLLCRYAVVIRWMSGQVNKPRYLLKKEGKFGISNYGSS